MKDRTKDQKTNGRQKNGWMGMKEGKKEGGMK